ncbi:Vacuolar protein-sorting-associated protein 36 [Cyphellophora attinorum]|uniref:Vacuolar protein-sorting-associated protein 36 n=1 Tax=Cyphellophora attinorum TaxID=1664694 RepID=A0A0N1HDP1_9EURO|nr:Vacuolar protein-sorting-associated protein 36 [Phialophora attinorum]KPI42646.1 Vacuolar protein-sorting-associated protein 36 [Phialophora attinorum]
MFFTKPDLTTGSRPALLPDETLLFVQDSVGLYEGKFKIASCQKGHAYLTSHRACYIDDADPRNNSLAVELKDVERHEYQAGFLRSSAKVTLHPKPLKRGYGTLRQHVATSPAVQRVASSSSPGSRSSSPFPDASTRISSPQIDRGNWVCAICSFTNPVPSNFDATIATEAFPLPPCLTCGIVPDFPRVMKAAVAANVKRKSTYNTAPPQSQSLLPHQQTPVPVSTDGATITCPRCTFHNHPSLRTCELCGADLPRFTPTSTGASPVERASSPGPEIASLNLNEDHGDQSVKFSFRTGGDKAFYEKLKSALLQRKWLLQQAPPIPQGETPSRTSTPDSSGPHSRPPSTAVGIKGLEQRGLQARRNNEAVLGSAFEDLEALMASAKEIVALAERFANESGSGTANPLLAESASALGMIATKDISGNSSNTLYITELSRNLAEYVTDEKRGILRSNGGIIGLVDLWAIVNRARNGVELISPTDFHQAAVAWDRLSLPVRLRQFRSGLLAVQPRNWTDERALAQITSWLQSLRQSPPEQAMPWDWVTYGCGVTAQEAASRFGWSVGVATEELEMAEERGVVCRDEGIEGLKFWLNFLFDGQMTDTVNRALFAENSQNSWWLTVKQELHLTPMTLRKSSRLDSSTHCTASAIVSTSQRHAIPAQNYEPPQPPEPVAEPQSLRERVVSVFKRKPVPEVVPKVQVAKETYKPAETWDGLDWLGDDGVYQHKTPTASEQYVPWNDKTRKFKGDIWYAVHQAIFTVMYPSEPYDHRQPLILTPGHPSTAKEFARGQSTGEISGDPMSFMNAPLNMKDRRTFEASKPFLKQLTLITGKKIPDPTLSSLAANPAATYTDLVTAIQNIKPAKPPKTFDLLQSNEQLVQAPNVKMHAKRIHVNQKDKDLGRWKVIEKELKERGLPLPFGARGIARRGMDCWKEKQKEQNRDRGEGGIGTAVNIGMPDQLEHEYGTQW